MPAIILGVGSAIASGVGSIFGAKANAAAAALRNQQAQQRWIQANTQKTINNARSQFQSAYQSAQQLKRNAAIMQSAYRNEFDQRNALKDQLQFQTRELSVNRSIAAGALTNALSARNINQNSGTYNALARAQLLNAMSNINQIQNNYQIQQKNISKQLQAEMSQMTENIFMPNIELYDAQPIYEDTGYSALPGLLQIGAGIAGGVAGMAGGAGTPSSGTTGGGYSTGMGGSSSNVGNFTNTPSAPGDISGGVGWA